MKYIEVKNFVRSLKDLNRKGGQFSKVATKVFAIRGKLDTEKDPFKGFKLTKYGEGRIKKCRKYDLGNGCRLITVTEDRNFFYFTLVLTMIVINGSIDTEVLLHL